MFTMPLRGFFFLLLVCVAQFSVASTLVPQPPQLSASAYILIDADSGYVITQKNADEVFPPASLTKMMTAYILAHELHEGNVSLSDQVRISEKAWRTKGSRMFVQEGKLVSLEDLMRGVIIQSGNDASVAVAEHIAGSEDSFASLMNQHAVKLGMVNTHFKNSTGLPAQDHHTTARDLSLLAGAIISDYPEHYSIYSEKEFTFNKIRQPNRNNLLWRDSSVDGLKTGHTQEAGYCLVASAKKDGQRLISVVLKADSSETRAQESQKLLSYGMRFFETHAIYGAYEKIEQARLWGGISDSVDIALTQNLTVTVPRNQAKNITAKVIINPDIEAPVTAGQELGQLQMMLNDELLVERALVAVADVPEGGFVKVVLDKIIRFVEGVLD